MAPRLKEPPLESESLPVDEFIFPLLHAGNLVEVTTQPDWADPQLGIVMKPKAGCAVILMIRGGERGGLVLLRDCIHTDDPRIKNQPELFEDGDRGMFRLAEPELLLRKVATQFQNLTDSLESLMARVATLEAFAKAAIKSEK